MDDRPPTLRPITLDDVDDIVAIVCAATGGSPDDPGWRLDAEEQARGAVANSVTYAIEQGGRIVGRLRVVTTDRLIEVAGLQIRPDRQRSGIGSAVLAGLIGQAQAARLPLELDVAHDNPGAQRLYRRLGFTTVGQDEHDLRMRHAQPTGRSGS